MKSLPATGRTQKVQSDQRVNHLTKKKKPIVLNYYLESVYYQGESFKEGGHKIQLKGVAGPFSAVKRVLPTPKRGQMGTYAGYE